MEGRREKGEKVGGTDRVTITGRRGTRTSTVC